MPNFAADLAYVVTQLQTLPGAAPVYLGTPEPLPNEACWIVDPGPVQGAQITMGVGGAEQVEEVIAITCILGAGDLRPEDAVPLVAPQADRLRALFGDWTQGGRCTDSLLTPIGTNLPDAAYRAHGVPPAVGWHLTLTSYVAANSAAAA